MPFEEWVVSHARVSKKPHKKATLEDTLTFFHQLSTLVSSGTPLLQALKIATGQCESTNSAPSSSRSQPRSRPGAASTAAAAAFPDQFEFQWIEAIRTGEITGKMAMVLVELNKQIRDSRETKRKVKASLMYPMILVCVAVIAVTLMLWMVVPTFAKMFHDMDAKLPAITQFVVDASDWIVKYGPYCLVGIIAAVIGFKKFHKTEAGRLYVGGFLMILPSVGELVIGMAMYQFASSISLLLKSGVPMMETMNTLTGIFKKNPIYHAALERVRSRVAAGKSLHSHSRRPASSCPCSPTWSRWARNRASLHRSWSRSRPFTRRRWRA